MTIGHLLVRFLEPHYLALIKIILLFFLDYLWLDTDKLNDVLESSDEPSSLPSQQQHHQQQQHHVQTEGHSEVLNNDVEQDIEDENCATVFSSSVKLKLKEESVNEEGNTIRKRK